MEANSAQAPCWSNIVKMQAAPKPEKQAAASTAQQVLVESCKSTKGLAVAVVDANAVIQGANNLNGFADKLVTVSEVSAEIRDPVSRHRLAFAPIDIQSMEPSPDALNHVTRFARATGDLQTLSYVDLKLIALTYTLEAQIHGTSHLRDIPPPVQTVNVKRLPEKDLPGWGTNVPNLEEWEALEQEVDGGSNRDSRILPLKDLNLNIIPSDNHSEDASVASIGESHSENQEDDACGFRKPKKYLPKKKEINIEGKMVADGIDASQGQFDDDAGDWNPAVSRSTRRRFLRRITRREYFEGLSEKESQHDLERCVNSNILGDIRVPDEQSHQSSEEAYAGNGISEVSRITEERNGDKDLSSILKQMKLEEDSLKALQEGNLGDVSTRLNYNNSITEEETSDNNANMNIEGDEVDNLNEGFEHQEISSQANGIVDASCFDDDSSEQSWKLRSFSESSVACVTGDFAMQNVLLQMGLRLVAPGGIQIRELHRWILKCHACYTMTAEIGRIFCPKCGNGGTLRKVAVTVGENGVVLQSRRPRITLRGTKFSLPLPLGGREAITKNLILREDQLPQKFLHPKTKKKANKQGDDFFTSDIIFTHHTSKKVPLQPSIGKALAVFSGKRNPNDNHFSRAKH
ncbi:NOB1_Zn_bind domain-containing protein [Cephalotus follicularis]|uniref:NOB1_Zn_bind domain-containing protein n=1 Tax=Cephalotus follicularis TaxID=3775 RepID=A0A1Q3AQU1_CEPFO|nr:NOB1_Zn_bind domain-containing protein [Cephalotus follicularis]